jgi:hypothetical protein
VFARWPEAPPGSLRFWFFFQLPEFVQYQKYIPVPQDSSSPDYTCRLTQDDRAAAEKVAELFGIGWLEKDAAKLISFPSPSQKAEGLTGRRRQALMNQ